MSTWEKSSGAAQSMSNIGIRNVLSDTKVNSIIVESSVNFASNLLWPQQLTIPFPGCGVIFTF